MIILFAFDKISIFEWKLLLELNEKFKQQNIIIQKAFFSLVICLNYRNQTKI
jgi:hypothetical protein